MAVAHDDFIALAGQIDSNDSGSIHNPYNLAAQLSGAIANVNRLLRKLDSGFAELVKLNVYYVQRDVAEPRLLQQIDALLDADTECVVTLVPLSRLAQPGLEIQIEAYAMRNADRESVRIPGLFGAGKRLCHGLRCGEVVFTAGQCALDAEGNPLFANDLVSQNRQTIENLQHILDACGVSAAEIVKGNSWRAPQPNEDAYTRAAQDRFSFFRAARPAVTGITVPGLAPIGQSIRLDVWAMDKNLPRTRITPADHWQWKIDAPYSHGLKAGDWLFVGGQAALDARCTVQQPTDLAAQVRITMAFIENILRDAGAHRADILKMNTYYCGPSSASEEDIDLPEYDALFEPSGPATTSVPVAHLAYSNQQVEIEAIAKLVS